MDPLCKYKNALGEPHKGFHTARIGPFAAGDTLLTLAAALVLTFLYSSKCNTEAQISHFILWFIALLFLGEILHVLFCVQTEGIIKLQDIFERKAS